MNKMLQLTAVSLAMSGGVVLSSATPAFAAAPTEHANFGQCHQNTDDSSSLAPGQTNFGPGNFKFYSPTDVSVTGPLQNLHFVGIGGCS